jgi:hypothetical protein
MGRARIAAGHQGLMGMISPVERGLMIRDTAALPRESNLHHLSGCERGLRLGLDSWSRPEVIRRQPWKVIAVAAGMCLPLAAHAETACIYIPRPCPPVGGYGEQVTHLRMQGISEADIKKYSDRAWQVTRDVPGTGVADALAAMVKLSGEGCKEVPPRVIGTTVPIPIATPDELRRYPRCGTRP